jgi:branched-chain amino acid transport system substrate-binding protein
MFILRRRALKILVLLACWLPPGRSSAFATGAHRDDRGPERAVRQHRRGGVPQPGWAVERVNARRRGAPAPRTRPLELLRYDSKGQNEETLAMLRAAIDDGAQWCCRAIRPAPRRR